MVAKIGERMGDGWALLLGRRTYEDFYAVWPKQTDSPFSDALNNAPKYVASRTLTEPLPRSNSILVSGDAADSVPQLKERSLGNLTIFGSGDLIRSLMSADLIDEYLLMVHPLVLGSGCRLFSAGQDTRLRLLDTATTTTGVVIATYAKAYGPRPAEHR